jgi:primosomal protein N' (replication factor Y)
VDVCVDDAPGHLDRPFTYAVPEAFAATVRPGVRVAVPFAGGDSPGWVLGVRPPAPDDPPGLRPVRRVVSPVPALTDEVAALARAVADRYAGTLADVLRSAVPPRHARAETALLAGAPAVHGVPVPVAPESGAWAEVTGGAALLRRLAAGQGPAAAATLPLAVPAWPALAALAAAALAGGRSALVVVPDAADVTALARALGDSFGDERVQVMHHDLGPAERWRGHLRVLTGAADVVVGTRAAVFAPVQNLGVIAVWDDADDVLVEPRAPGWHAREVALLRSRAAGAGLALVSHARSVAAQWLVRQGTVRDLAPARQARRRLGPKVVVPMADDPVEASARLPRTAHRAVADGLERGPVLVHVPRRGGVPSLRCRRCSSPAVCRACDRGCLVVLQGDQVATCPWCGHPATGWACRVCGAAEFRAGAVGSGRTSHELGLAFRGVTVLTSDGQHRLVDVPDRPALVVATPGAEPRAASGFAAAVVLDGDATLQRRGLDAGEQAVRRWLHVASLVRPAPDGGVVVLVADRAAPEVQAVLADAPERYADRSCDDREAAGLPPARTVATITGDDAAIRQVLGWLRGEGMLDLDLHLEPGGAAGPADGPQGRPAAALEVLGPAPAGEGQGRLLLAGPHADVVRTCREVTRRRAVSPGDTAGRSLVVRVDPPAL